MGGPGRAAVMFRLNELWRNATMAGIRPRHPPPYGLDRDVVQAWRDAAIYDAQAGTPITRLCAMARERALGRLKKRLRTLGPTAPAADGPLAEHTPY
jgi:hypothetical protein